MEHFHNLPNLDNALASLGKPQIASKVHPALNLSLSCLSFQTNCCKQNSKKVENEHNIEKLTWNAIPV